MKSLRNSVQLIGNIGNDIKFQTFDSGTALAKFPLATSEYYRNNKGEKVEETQWHNIVAWGKTAEYINQSLKKGQQVALKGQIKYNSYESKDGIKRYSCDIVCNEFIRLTKEEAPF